MEDVHTDATQLPPTPEPALKTPAPTRLSMHPTVIALTFIAGILLGVGGLFGYQEFASVSDISSYEDCLKASGSVIQERYPPTCVARNGKRFTQTLTDEPVITATPKESSPGWTPYENKEFQFAFSYPRNATVTTIEPAQYREYGVSVVVPAADSGSSFRMSVQIIGRKKSTYTELAESFYRHDAGWMNDPTTPLTTVTTRMIADVYAAMTSKTLCGPADAGCEQTDYYFLDSGKFNFLISASYPIGQNGQAISPNITDQLLSTVRFSVNRPTQTYPFTCPKTEWVDCMPGPNQEGIRFECTEEFLTWAKAHCPGFKGAAY